MILLIPKNFELKNILEILPLLYAVFSSLSILYFIGYYIHLDALWLLKDISISDLIISTSYQMIGFIFGAIFAIQSCYNKQFLDKKEINFITLISKFLLLVTVIVIILLSMYFFSTLKAQVAIFSVLYLFGFILTYIFLINQNTQINFFKKLFTAQIILGIGIAYYCCGSLHAYLKIELNDFYQIVDNKNKSEFYMLEKQNDQIVAFRKNPNTETFEFKFMKLDDVKLLKKD